MTGPSERSIPPRGHVRFIGSALAFFLALAGGLALVSLAAILPLTWSTARLWLLLGALASGIGALVGGILGWQLAPLAADRRIPLVRAAISATWRAILAGAALVAASALAAPGDDLARLDQVQLSSVVERIIVPIGVRAGWALTSFAIGVMVFAIPAALVVAPVVSVWILLLRRAVGDAATQDAA
jgi:hypothetical protein